MADLLFKSRLAAKIGARHAKPQFLAFRSRAVAKIGARHDAPQFLAFKSRAVSRPDIKYGGHGYIAGEAEGIVTVGGQPAARRIYLFARPQMVCVADTWSRDDGTYRFDRLDENTEFLMVGTDYKKQYEPVSYDFVRPFVDKGG